MNVNPTPTRGSGVTVQDCSTTSTQQKFAIQATSYDATKTGYVVGSGGSNPCATTCNSPTITGQSYGNSNLGTGASCFETTASLQGGGTSNMTGRTFTINGVAQGASFKLPAKVNGGYCIQVGAGGASYASFNTW